MLKILIVDDEKYERESAVRIIKDEFNEELFITEAKNGREAIEVAEKISPDIIVMDINMPGINGIKALEEIRKTNERAYFIILTAYDYFDFAMEAVKLNVREYILKPFGRKEMIGAIEKGINKINKEKEKRKAEIESEEKINNLMKVLRKEVSENIINNRLDNIESGIYKEYLNFDFNNSYAIIFLIKEAESKEILNKIGEYIYEYINLSNKAIWTTFNNCGVIFFVENQKVEDSEEQINASIHLAMKIKERIYKNFNIQLKIAIGNSYCGLENMNKSYVEARKALKQIGEDIIHISKIQNKVDSKILLFKKVEQYISSNISDTLDLESVAGKFNLSCFYFSRSFKEVLGCNYSDYINKIRVEKAKDLLINSELTVKEICYLVGYSDPNYFSKVFKKYEGKSPNKVRSMSK